MPGAATARGALLPLVSGDWLPPRRCGGGRGCPTAGG